MADIRSKEARSRNMAAIRSKNTKPEKYICSLLHRRGFRFRKHVSIIPGHPDLYLAKYHTAVFVHGCFWHRHKNCKFAYMPKTHEAFWQKKFKDNIKRDIEVRNKLSDQGTKCLVIWECTINRMIKNEEYEKTILNHICAFLQSDSARDEI